MQITRCGYPTLTSFKKPGNSEKNVTFFGMVSENMTPLTQRWALTYRVLQRSRLLNYLQVDVWQVYPIELYTSMHIDMKCVLVAIPRSEPDVFYVRFLFTVLIVSVYWLRFSIFWVSEKCPYPLPTWVPSIILRNLVKIWNFWSWKISIPPLFLKKN